MRRTKWALFASMAVVVSACGGDDGNSGASKCSGDDCKEESSGDLCSRDSDCDDGSFCNGAEYCDPDHDDADADGCVADVEPDCDDGIACTEDSCDDDAGECAHDAPDEDGDGHGDSSCEDEEGEALGDDCDDDDADRFPGNLEVCDSDDRDEDCDDSTFGDRDEDGDGAVSDQCCNGDNCGDDCDDTDLTMRPQQPEFCDDKDNNCDGEVDNDTQEVEWFLDLDGDLFGDLGSEPVISCEIVVGSSVLPTDCNDDDVAQHRARDERCGDDVDNNCNGVIDEGPDCEPPEGRPVVDDDPGGWTDPEATGGTGGTGGAGGAGGTGGGDTGGTGGDTGGTGGDTGGTGGDTGGTGGDTGGTGGDTGGSGGTGGSNEPGCPDDYRCPTHYWSMDDSDVYFNELDDGIGTQPGLINGSTVVPGKVGEALRLDGNNDYVDLGTAHQTIVGGTDSTFTLSLWFQRETMEDNEVLLASHLNSACVPAGNGRQFQLRIKDDVVALSYSTSGTTTYADVVGDDTIVDSGWHHLLVAYDGTVDGNREGRVDMFLDGNLQTLTLDGSSGNFPFDIDVTSAALGLGAILDANGSPCATSGDQVFGGVVDEVAIWDAALTFGEIAAIYDRGVMENRLVECDQSVSGACDGMGDEAVFRAPVAYWDLDSLENFTDVPSSIGSYGGVMSGGVSEAAGQVGGALAFDGSTGVVDFGDILDDVFSGAGARFTISMWVLDGSAAEKTVLIGKNEDSSCPSGYQSAREFSLRLAPDGYLSSVHQTPSNPISTENWETTAPIDSTGFHHVVWALDTTFNPYAQGRLDAYIDGQLVSTTSLQSSGTFPFDISDGPAPLALGAGLSSGGEICSNSNGRPFLGSIDELAIWDDVLTGNEVAAVYAAGLAGERIDERFTFEDQFAGQSLSDFWLPVADALYTIDVNDGVHIAKPAGGDGTRHFAGLNAQYLLRGDFDVELDFSGAVLDRLGGGIANQIELQFHLGAQFYSLVRDNKSSAPVGDNVHVWAAPPSSLFGQQATADTEGTLRVVRVGSDVFAYFNDTLIHNATYNDSDADVAIVLQNNETTDAISVSFDAFRVSAQEFVPIP